MFFFTCLGHDPFFQMESVEKANGSFIPISILVTIVRPRIRVSIMPSLQPLQLHQFLNHEKKKHQTKFHPFSRCFPDFVGFPYESTSTSQCLSKVSTKIKVQLSDSSEHFVCHLKPRHFIKRSWSPEKPLIPGFSSTTVFSISLSSQNVMEKITR